MTSFSHPRIGNTHGRSFGVASCKGCNCKRSMRFGLSHITKNITCQNVVYLLKTPTIPVFNLQYSIYNILVCHIGFFSRRCL